MLEATLIHYDCHDYLARFWLSLVKTDTIYYQLFKRFPSLIFALVDYPPQQAKGYRFESIEVKETAVDSRGQPTRY
jgi:Protein of unknown function (DUF2887)